MLQQFISHVQQQHLFPTGQVVLLAVSGGIDSCVLAHLMSSARYPFAIAHCNFHLRPVDCDRDEAFVRRLAHLYGVEVHVAQFDTAHYAQLHHLSIEDAARRQRYQFFEQVRFQHGYAAILTAHHRDDMAETFFLNLLRGTGLSGLHGILPVQQNIVRPLLPFGRNDIEHYASQHHLSHVEDSTNASLRFRRNQIRHQVIPLLRSLYPTADRAIQHSIGNLQSVERLYLNLLEPVRSQMVHSLPDGTMAVDLPPAFDDNGAQLLFELLRPFGFNYPTVLDILSSSQSGRLFYSHTHQALLDRRRLLLRPLPHGEEASLPLASASLLGQDTIPSLPKLSVERLPHFNISSIDFKHLPPFTAYFDANAVSLPLSLRHWRQGDRFQPFGMPTGSQLLSDYFSDHKYSLFEKQSQLLLVDACDRILWIVGRRTAHPFRVTQTTTAVFVVSVFE